MAESMPDNVHESLVDLSEREVKAAEERSGIRAHVVHEAVRLEGEEELKRPPSALAWSGFAAGLSMGFSLIGEGLLRAHIPDAIWRPLIAKLGYSFGFVLVVMGRQQLFTENTLTAVLPLLNNRDRKTVWRALRLWAVVFAANLAGAVVIAWVLGNTGVFPPEVRNAFAQNGWEALNTTFGLAVLRGIFAGWLIAFMVWMLPAAEAFRLVVIVGLTWIIGVAGFPHIIAGSIETLFLVTTGAASWQLYLAGYMLPVLLGNILGGVSLVAALNHAQVVAK